MEHPMENIDSEFERNHTCESCLLSGTPHCKLLNARSCSSCSVRKKDRQTQQQIMEDIRTIAAAMPYGGLEEIKNGESCCLCSGEKKAADAGYARFPLAHLHPKATNESAKENKGYKRDVSFVVPVQLPVCKKCRKHIGLMNFLPICLGTGIALAIVLCVVCIKPLCEMLSAAGRAIPLLVSLIGIFLGIIASSLSKIILYDSLSKKTELNPSKVSEIASLINEGWFVVPNAELELPYTCSSKSMKSGILTCSNQEQIIEAIINWNGKQDI